MSQNEEIRERVELAKQQINLTSELLREMRLSVRGAMGLGLPIRDRLADRIIKQREKKEGILERHEEDSSIRTDEISTVEEIDGSMQPQTEEAVAHSRRMPIRDAFARQIDKSRRKREPEPKKPKKLEHGEFEKTHPGMSFQV